MMTELGITPSAAAVARRYGDLLDGYVMDGRGCRGGGADHAEGDAGQPTLMTTLAERAQLAEVVPRRRMRSASSKRGTGPRRLSQCLGGRCRSRKFEGANMDVARP